MGGFGFCIGSQVSLLDDLLDVLVQVVLLTNNLSPSLKRASIVDKMLLICLVERFEVELRVGQVQLFV